jgi:GGDEF domain-containing protein
MEHERPLYRAGEVTLLLPIFSNDRVALLILLAAIPTTTAFYLLSFVAPAPVVILLTAAMTGAICVLAMAQHEKRTKVDAGSKRLISSLLERQILRGKRLVIVDPETMLFKRWYFELRLSEEISRCQRYGSSMTIIGLKKIDEPAPKGKEQAPEESELDFVQVFNRSLRSVDLAARVGSGEYCVCLPHTDKSGGESVVRRLLHEFGSTRMAVSVVEFRPEDADLSEILISRTLADVLPGEAWRTTLVEQPKPIDIDALVTSLADEESGEVRLTKDETAKSIKARLRRAAKRSGFALTISERDGVVRFRRAKKAQPEEVAA